VERSNRNPLAEPGGVGETSHAAMMKILARWSELELLLERSGKSDQLVADLQAYIADLRDEAKTIKSIRSWMIYVAAAYVVFVNLLLVCLLFYHPIFFLALGAYGKAVLIIGVFSSSVILIAKILAGLFRTHGDRNKDEIMPPHLQAMVEAFRATQSQ
jgi:hypothetical protein